jgi:hypothetical protein
MNEEVLPTIKKKIVSFSQFTNWFVCPAKWKLDYIDKLKSFEDSLHMSFGTAIHESIQNYLKTYFYIGEVEANAVNSIGVFVDAFKRELEKKKIPHTPNELSDFITDGENILSDFLNPVNLKINFCRNKWELLAIEDDLNVEILNNVILTGKLDLVLREKTTGQIRIIDFKTSGNGWTTYQKEDFTKTSQLVIYKALYSKHNNIPLNNIKVEFIILKRKLYENVNYEQSRLQIFKPSSFQSDVLLVIQEFQKFVTSCFTSNGQHNTDNIYPKVPGKNKKNCKYCPHLKNKKCDGVADPIDF